MEFFMDYILCLMFFNRHSTTIEYFVFGLPLTNLNTKIVRPFEQLMTTAVSKPNVKVPLLRIRYQTYLIQNVYIRIYD